MSDGLKLQCIATATFSSLLSCHVVMLHYRAACDYVYANAICMYLLFLAANDYDACGGYGSQLWTAAYRTIAGDNSSFKWKLNDGTLLPFTYNNWHSPQPDKTGDCMTMMTTLKYIWNDAWCSYAFCFVCEIQFEMNC